MTWKLGILEVGVIPGLPLTAYLPGAPQDALIDPPCFCYAATNGTRVILVDSGPDRAASAAAGLAIAGDTSAQLLAGLRAFGASPEDVSLIVHTHLHYDHVQNDLLFPRSTVAVQRSELAWATGPSAGPFYVGVDALADALDDRLRLLDGETEILPGLRALPSGGHTPGHQSVLLRTPGGEVCVCGDIVSLQENTEIIGPACPDVAQAEAFLQRAAAAGRELVPSHDPKLRKHRWFVPPGDVRDAADIPAAARSRP